jgi:hypothetical protein
MKISLKNIFLIIIFFTKNTILSINNKGLCQPNKEVVVNSIKEIVNTGLDNLLYDSLLNDIEVLMNRVYGIVDQMNSNYAHVIQNKDNLDEMTFDYKYSAFCLNKLREANILSKETQINILTSFLFGLSNMIVQKTKMKKLLDDDRIGGVLFLMTAMGIEFSTLSVVEKIIFVIEKAAMNLKNDNLDDLVYHATMYDVFHKISETIISKQLCSVVADKIVNIQLTTMKEEINVCKNKNSKHLKKNKR